MLKFYRTQLTIFLLVLSQFNHTFPKYNDLRGLGTRLVQRLYERSQEKWFGVKQQGWSINHGVTVTLLNNGDLKLRSFVIERQIDRTITGVQGYHFSPSQDHMVIFLNHYLAQVYEVSTMQPAGIRFDNVNPRYWKWSSDGKLALVRQHSGAMMVFDVYHQMAFIYEVTGTFTEKYQFWLNFH